MTNYRKILEMHSQGFSQRSIESSVHSSHQTIKAVLDRAKELNVSWPLDDNVTKEVLDELFYGERKSDITSYLLYLLTVLPKWGSDPTDAQLGWVIPWSMALPAYCRKTYSEVQ